MAALVRGREVSPVELLEAHLSRVEKLNPRLNAIVTLNPAAPARAREIEAALARGEEVGPLAGVPVTVKDTIETAGLRTTFGSRVYGRHVPREDAPAVARLRAAGAVILGKTNASEFALDYTADNPVFGRTNNPYDLRMTPGGSSGGCATTVCACMAAAGLGSDLAGSIRIPAHFCGVAGLRPTAARVPSGGQRPPATGPYSLGASLGPIARRVEDLALLFNVLSSAGAGRQSDEHSTKDLDASVGRLNGLRVAWYADDGAVPVTPETRRALKAAAVALGGAGASVSEALPPHVGRATELWTALFSQATEDFLRSTYGGREGEAGPVARLLLERGARARRPSIEDYFNAWGERDRLRAELLAWMEEAPLLLAPVGAVGPVEHDTRKVSPDGKESFSMFRAFGYAQSFNVFDLPAATVRVGWTEEGLPIGVQVVGRPFEERLVIAGALVIEGALGGWQSPPEILSNEEANPL